MTDSILGGTTQIPDAMREEANRILLKVGAYVRSGGDPAALKAFDEPPSVFMLLLLTIGLGIVVAIISQIGNYYEVRQNWSHYQCQPDVAPFAKFYGHDPVETMNFCVGQAVKAHSAGVIDPVYKGVAEVVDIVDDIYLKIVAFEGGVAGLLSGFQTFVVNFINSFRLLGTRVRMSLILFKEILQRIWGVFIAFTYAAISAITFGENLVCNPLVTFVAGFAGVDLCCFSPETQIRMRSGSIRSIDSLRIGDELWDGGVIESVYRFDGTATTAGMVRIRGVHVSANHYVQYGAHGWIRADAHPNAVKAEVIPIICCLGTTTHRIPVAIDYSDPTFDLIFTDYEESSDASVITAAQRAAEIALNPLHEPLPPVSDYSLGLDPMLHVGCADGTWVPLKNLKMGTPLVGGGSVIGIIQEECEWVHLLRGGHAVSAAQLIWNNQENRWKRAIYHYLPRADPQRLMHIMVSKNCPFMVRGDDGTTYVMRDYTEWQGPETETPYTDYLAQGKI